VIGGLHYPLPHGRWRKLGFDLQNLLVYGPFDAPSLGDVEHDVTLLASHVPRWVSLSAHDSSDEVIEAFRRTFGEAYHDLSVGSWRAVAP
jgi:hypothetical protein